MISCVYQIKTKENYLNKPAKFEQDHIGRVPDLITPRILKITNSFIYVVDKKRMGEYVKFFHNFKLIPFYTPTGAIDNINMVPFYFLSGNLKMK